MTAPPSRRAGSEFGVYIHVPFCAHRCDYCAFATWDDRGHLIDAYLDALSDEVRAAVDDGLPEASSVFVGGGTPTVADPLALAGLLGSIPVARGAEITVECNPESLTARHVDVFLAAGVTRLSLGVQSMVSHVLAALGRQHDLTSVSVAVGRARSGGFDNLNVDLIYGAVGESLGDWQATLDAALDLEPEHVSAYALTVEAGTPLAADPVRHPDDDGQAEKYALATDVLGSAGLEWYEISNWARPGRRCRHNLLYWSQGDYRGFGCAAHSHERGRRWWNIRSLERYIGAVRSGGDVVAGSEVLAADEQRLEALQLALRTGTGVPADALGREDADALEGLVERDADRIVLTRAGRLLANEVAIRLR